MDKCYHTYQCRKNIEIGPLHPGIYITVNIMFPAPLQCCIVTLIELTVVVLIDLTR